MISLAKHSLLSEIFSGCFVYNCNLSPTSIPYPLPPTYFLRSTHHCSHRLYIYLLIHFSK